MGDIPRLSTERLLLREWLPSDREPFAALNADPRVAEFLAEIVSFTTVTNSRSRAVMERLGLIHDPADDFDHPVVPVGDPLRAHVLYRLGRDAWRSAAAG